VIVLLPAVDANVIVELAGVNTAVEEAVQEPPMECASKPAAVKVEPEQIFMLPSQASPDPPALKVTFPPGANSLFGQIYNS